MIQFKELISKYKRKVKGVSELNCGMNPFDYWYQTIPQMRNRLDGMFAELLHMPFLEESFIEMVKRLYDTSGCRYKIQLISALYSIKTYFI